MMTMMIRRSRFVLRQVYDDCMDLFKTVVEDIHEYDGFAQECEGGWDTRSLIYAVRDADCKYAALTPDGEGWVLLLRQDTANGMLLFCEI